MKVQLVENRLAVCVFFFAIVFATAAIVMGADGVRGTDQYNYLADTETVLAKEVPLTNLFFPAKLIREGDSPTPAWFHHNGPPIYVAAWLGQWLGAYSGWVLMNLLGHLLVGLSIALMLFRFTDLRIALWSASLYYVSPIAIWLAMNVLQETFFAAILALTLVGFVCRRTPFLLVIGALGLVVGVLSHPFFKIVALFILLYCLIESLMAKHYPSIAFAFVYAAFVLVCVAHSELWFPSSFQPDLKAIITSAVPGESNMFWHYSLVQREINIELIVEKFLVAAKRHFFSPSNAPFYFYTNMAVVSLVYLLCFHSRMLWQSILLISVCLGLYAAMIVLQQNQPRYQHIVSVVSFYTIGLAWWKSKIRLSDKILVMCFVCSIGVAGYLTHVASSEAKYQREKLQQLASMINDAGLSRDARIVAFDLTPHSPLAVTLKPKLVLSVRTDMMKQSDIQLALNRFEPTHAFFRHTEAANRLATSLGFDMASAKPMAQTYFGDIQVMQISVPPSISQEQ